MGKYLLVYHGGSQPETEEAGKEVMGQWMKWMEGVGSSMVDGGHPIGQGLLPGQAVDGESLGPVARRRPRLQQHDVGDVTAEYEVQGRLPSPSARPGGDLLGHGRLAPEDLTKVHKPFQADAEVVRRVVERVLAVSLQVELLCVDDGSTDGSREILLDLQRQLPGIKGPRVSLRKGDRLCDA